MFFLIFFLFFLYISPLFATWVAYYCVIGYIHRYWLQNFRYHISASLLLHTSSFWIFLSLMFLWLYKFLILVSCISFYFFISALPIGRIINVTFLSMHGKHLGIFTAHRLTFDILKSQCMVMGMKMLRR